MKKRILAGAAALGLSVLVAGIGPAFAGGGGGIAPQEHWTSQPDAAIETGALTRSDVEKRRSDVEKRALETSRYETAQGAGTGNTLPESGIVPEEQ